MQKSRFIAVAIVVVFFCMPFQGRAASYGPNNGRTFSSNNTVGTRTWSNPSRAETNDDSHATTTRPDSSSYVTEYLSASNFGFDIPSDATINGVEVSVAGDACNDLEIKDGTIKLILRSVISGDNKANTSTFWDNAEETHTYGSASDTWGATLDPSTVNNPSFGVVVSLSIVEVGGITANCIGASVYTVRIDHITITVHYTAAGSSTVSTVSSSGGGSRRGAPGSGGGKAPSLIPGTRSVDPASLTWIKQTSPVHAAPSRPTIEKSPAQLDRICERAKKRLTVGSFVWKNLMKRLRLRLGGECSF